MVAAAHHGDVEKIWLRWLTTPEQLRDNHASSETMRWRHGGSMETTSRRWRQSRKKKLTIVLFPLTATRLRHLSRSRFFRHSIKRFIVSPLLQSSFQSLSLSLSLNQKNNPDFVSVQRMPATDFQGTFGRSFLSFRRDQVDSNTPAAGSSSHSMEAELDSFQRQVAEKFTDLNASGELLSLEWIGKLLDSFLCCQEEFRAIVFNHRSQISTSPMNRLISEYFERSIKALDVCNAIRDGIEQIRQWQKLSDIVISALDSRRTVGEGQLRRAKKALVDLAIGMLDEKETSLAHRNRSFGRVKDSHSHHRSMGHFRSLSWSVSRSWSASKQLQALASNLNTPRQNDVVASNGLAVPVYTMASVLLFVMWVLVAAFPCQDRGLQVNFFVPRQFQWAAPVMSLHDKIVEESKRRDRKNCCGLLKEIGRIEKSSRVMNELIDSIHFPMSEEKEIEVKQRVEELVEVHEALKNGLDPFERKVREVFHRIVRSRTENLDSLC